MNLLFLVMVGLLPEDRTEISVFDSRWQLYVHDGRLTTRLSQLSDQDFAPVLSPDGKQVVYASDRNDNVHLYLMNWDGSDARQLTDLPGRQIAPVWSPDSRYVAFNGIVNRNWDIYVVDVICSESSDCLWRLTNAPSMDIDPAWSPDSSGITFISRGNGQADVYVVDSDGNNLRQVTNALADEINPEWTPDGRAVVFTSVQPGSENRADCVCIDTPREREGCSLCSTTGLD